jgi:hypothetical protein
MTDAENEVLLELKKSLAVVDRRYPLLPGLVYRSHYGFVLEHGRHYERRPWDGRYRIGVQKQCYANAIKLAARFGLKYIEGLCVSPEGGEVIFHAWNADAEDQLIDCTWGNTGVAYLGVEFSVERADDAQWNGDACVLNDEHRHYPIFQRRWTGEDYQLKWPHSDRLDYDRRGLNEYPPSVLEWCRNLEPR